MSEQNNGKFVKGWFYHGVKLSKWENDRGEGKKAYLFQLKKAIKTNLGNIKNLKHSFLMTLIH